MILIQDAAESLGATLSRRARRRPGRAGRVLVQRKQGDHDERRRNARLREPYWIEHARKLSTQARDVAPHYEHTEIGFNYRLSNLLAAVGRAQLAVLPERVDARRRVNGRYRELLADAPGISFMPEAPYGESNCWLTCIVVDPDEAGTDRERIRLALEAEDIESRPLWKPMHLQPVFADVPAYGGEVSARLFERGLCLPSGSALTEDDQRRVVEILLATRA